MTPILFAVAIAACGNGGDPNQDDSATADGSTGGNSGAASGNTDADGDASAGSAGCEGSDCDMAVLTWQAPTTNEDGSPLTDLARYRVHVGTTPGAYDESFDAGLGTTYTAVGLAPGARYYFAVTSLDASGNESVFSNEVSKDL